MRPPDWQNDDGSVQLYCGDSLKLLPTMELGVVDAAVTDLPYGIGVEYGVYEDTKEKLIQLVTDSMPMVRAVSPIVALFCGNGNQHLYPVPDWTMAWFYDGGTNFCKWGFNCWQPVLVYGADPFLARGMGCRSDSLVINETPRPNGHPCPKPYHIMEWLVKRVTVSPGSTVLDHFMGSGTTGVAAVRSGRKFIGIEIEQEFFKIAVKRIKKELSSVASSFQIQFEPKKSKPDTLDVKW